MADVKKVAVVGAGTMGHGIAQMAAMAGYEVRLHDAFPAALRKGLESIERNLSKGVELKKVTPENAEQARKRIVLAEALRDAVLEADLVIEAIPEEIALKTDLFRQLDEMCKADAILATNTSALSPTEIAASTKRPGRCIGMHFFNPVHIMKLVEVVRGLETTDETTATVTGVAVKMGKEPVVIEECPGFVTTRLNALIGNEAFNMVLEGVASPEAIDKAAKLGLNHPMGPLELADLVGLDTRLRILQYLHGALGDRFRPSPLLVKYVKAGRLGRKSGKGVYEYPRS